MMYDFITNVDFFRDMLDQRLSTRTKDEELNGCQLGFGHLVEFNLIQAMMYCRQENHVRITKADDDLDRIFGADAKVEFLCPQPKGNKIHKMSCYIDVTIGDKQALLFNGGKSLCTLSNGLDVHIGYKNAHLNLFRYEKPIILVQLKSPPFTKINPMFTVDDVAKVIKTLRHACLYLSYELKYEFDDKVVKGTGKLASTNISLNERIIK